MFEGFYIVYGLMFYWFFSEESEEYERIGRGRVRLKGFVKYGIKV